MIHRIILLSQFIFWSNMLIAQSIAESSRITPEALGMDGYGYFGYAASVVANDLHVAVGNSSLTDFSHNSVSIYENASGILSLDTILYFGQEIQNTFGDHLLLFDDYLFIGQTTSSIADGQIPSVYVYKHINDQWYLTQTIVSPITSDPIIFGSQMLRAGNHLIIEQYDNPQAYRVLTYELVGDSWNFVHVIDEDARDAVMAGNHMILKVNSSYPNTDTLQIKSYDWIDNGWQCMDTLLTYGMSDNYRLINHPEGSELVLIHNQVDSNYTTLYSYSPENAGWSLQDSIHLEQIGFAHTMDAHRLLISHSGNHHGLNSGKVDYYGLNNGVWQYLTELIPTTLGPWDKIGRAMCLHGGKAFVTSFELNDSNTHYDGALFTFNLSGCADPEACNYDPTVPFDTELCLWPTCLDELACNYNPTGCDGGECLYPMNSADTDCSGNIDESDLNACIDIFGCVGDCTICDLDNDGVVGTNDIIILISLMD